MAVMERNQRTDPEEQPKPQPKDNRDRKDGFRVGI